MSRTRMWSAECGNTAQVIADALAPTFAPLIYRGIKYVSDDMKVGVDANDLAKDAETLKGLISLDTRGGYFGHLDMTVVPWCSNIKS